jgi:sugar/nucleoside kinase (ribokinase family)
MPTFNNPIALQKRNTDLLCVGELLVDMIATQYGSLVECGEFQRFAGGSPANIALNARRLGISAEVAAAVGLDSLGDFLVRSLAEAELDVSLIQRREESTSLVLITRSRDAPTPIFYRGADYRLAMSGGLESRLIESSILHFSCWPLSMEPARSCVETMIAVARGNGTVICCDPNYHPSVWKDRPEALAFFERYLPYIDVVKPSEDDADRLFGVDAPEKHMRRFLELGAKLVIMTLGRDGAIASDGKETREYPSLAGEVVDATGAGDAFWAGLYAGLVGKRSVDRAIRLGMAVSAIKLRGVGAAVPPASVAEIESGFGLRVEEA